ncbi:hypothetical protein chiPu_0032846, partial [Chiloscyllium punctatum]|nr:hypothetical protein [Chiloscyllium punctatum]
AQDAVERRDGILQHRGAGRAGGPAPERKAIVAVDALLAGEGQRQQRVLLVQEVDDEMALLADARVRAGIAVDADQNRGRIVRQRAGRGHRQAGALPGLRADRHQRDRAGAMAHRLLETLCVDRHVATSVLKYISSNICQAGCEASPAPRLAVMRPSRTRRRDASAAALPRS